MIEETGLDTLHKMFICNLTHQVLTKSYFIFNGEIYIQKQGTAMGTRLTHNYAIIIHALHRIKFVKQVNIETKNMAQIYR